MPEKNLENLKKIEGFLKNSKIIRSRSEQVGCLDYARQPIAAVIERSRSD